MSPTRWSAAIAAAAIIVISAALVPGAQARAVSGIAADIPSGSHLPHAVQAQVSNLPYLGGPVLHSNRTHLIFWQPAGSGLSFEPGYASLVESFLANVAGDSRQPTNVYGLSGQYTDAQGPAAYDSTYGGAVLDTNPLPGNGCFEPLLTGPGWIVCLTDEQLLAELNRVIVADHLPTSNRDVYFLLTPDGFGDCIDGTSSSCALGGEPNGYCGYHASAFDDTLLYAVIPYNAVYGHCQSGNPRPNSSPADPAISTLSHEHNEMVTDPLGNAWIDSSNSENGDRCISRFGPAQGGAGSTAWNQVIHGGHYYLQEEWSNDDSSCQPADELDQVSFVPPSRPRAGKPATFTGHGVDPDGSIAAYDWYFGDGTGHRRIDTHTYKRVGAYTVVLRITDSAGNRASYARTVRVRAALTVLQRHSAKRR